MQSNKELIVEPVGLDVETLGGLSIGGSCLAMTIRWNLRLGWERGTFLTEQAKARPEVNFFGIEWARWFWRYASDRLRRNGCVNARTVRAEASYFLVEFVPAQSISVLHIYFPDPWPKARHNKRRLIQPKFMPMVSRVLVPDGRVQIVTDHADYFEQIEATVKGSGLNVIDYNRPGSAGEGEFVGTNFERKYQRQGRPFYAIAAMNGGLVTAEN